ncbi:hypothetical protein BT69DRAFT_1281662 [Atractiella rhizophila]|nr:hypothetical protein BT69DRAFT_1281662 [Atractiella rhizophila]
MEECGFRAASRNKFVGDEGTNLQAWCLPGDVEMERARGHVAGSIETIGMDN